MRIDDTDSVTGWIKGLGSSRHEHASHRLWDRYFTKIARLAQVRLRRGAGGPSDGEDVAASVFESFFRGAAAGRFERLDSREDLWRLLVTIASRKIGTRGQAMRTRIVFRHAFQRCHGDGRDRETGTYSRE